ncbi:MAG TPA: DUF1614 domain-containing protein [Acidiferrobacterales bacterium]|nr:DUF1614 domain-containing protein [Acidiferrobacterales bacterium]
MRTPFAPLPLLLFIGLLVLLVSFVQVGALTLAFDKLGLSAESGFLLLFVSLFGSVINLPLFTVSAEAPPAEAVPVALRGLLRHTAREFHGRTLIAMNVGGGLIPVMFSLYLIGRGELSLSTVMAAVGIVALVSYLISRPLPGIGISMPIFVAPVAAALTALLLDPEHSAALAYVSGTLGVLIGADLMRLKDIRRMGTPLAAIGGAGTFDGIFMTGIVAVLLA